MAKSKKKPKIVVYDHDPFVGGKESASYELIKALNDKDIIYAYTGSIHEIVYNRMNSICTVLNMNENGDTIECDTCIYSTVWHIETRFKAKDNMILWFHGMNPHTGHLLKAINFTDYVAVSETCRNYYLKQFGINSKVIYNLIDVKALIEKSKEPYELPFGKGKDITICTVSRISYEKGIEKLPFIGNGINKLGYDYKWYIIGEYNSNIMRDKIGKIYQHTKDFHFLGNMDNPHKVTIQCDFIAQFSPVETQGLSVTEGRLLGKPAILSDIPAFREFFPNDIFVKAVDQSTIKNIMEKKPVPFEYRNDLDKWIKLIYKSEKEIK